MFTAFPEIRRWNPRSRSTHAYGLAITAARVQAVNGTGAGLASGDGFFERLDRTQGFVYRMDNKAIGRPRE